jgi:cobalt/nickel transport system permease protein
LHQRNNATSRLNQRINMHIPDGYLSPATAGVMYAAAAPFWYVAARRVRQTLTGRTVPTLALFAAFSFVLMMFNIPLPGGTTGHAVGGTLLAIVLGPWAAILGVSVVLLIQALFFADGGLIAFGANCFNMAIVLPLVGYFVYKVISSNSDATSPRRLAAAVIASYTALVAAAFLTAVEFGIQPHFFHTPDGTPLYCPYNLGQAIPAMMGGHLLIAGPAEALVTGLVFAFLQRTHSSLIQADAPAKKEGRIWILWGTLGLLALVTPIGLLASGTAWGEWGIEELQHLGLGSIPGGLERFTDWWPAPLPDYGLPRMGAVIGYILSAFIGIALVAIFLWIAGRALVRKSRESPREQKPQREQRYGVHGKDFLSKNLSRITSALESVISSEDLCRAPGLLQGLDPRLKLATLALFIIVVSLMQSLPTLGGVFALILILALSSRVSLSIFLKRILVFIPIFTLIIAIPALFITQGEPLTTLGNLTITEQGARTAGLLVLRVTDCLSFATLLILTTRWTNILAALRWFRMPTLFVATLGMTYRYIFLLLHSANSMFLARRSRTLGSFSGRENRRWLGQALATTMSKSHYLSEEVYMAMLSRGYKDDGIVLNNFSLKRRDALWTTFAVAISSLLIWSNYL